MIGRSVISLGLASLLTLSTAISSCSRSESGSGDYALDVVATTAMIGDVVRKIGGDRIRVRTIMGEGVDPHLYRATRADMALMLEADVIFYNGHLLEGKMTDALIQVARRKPVFAVTELVQEEELLEPPGASGHFDPHLWMDPVRWEKIVDVVLGALAALDRMDSDGHRARAADYLERLRALDAYAEQAMATIPESSRILVTAHDAFNYFADRYDIEVMGIQGISTDSEAGVADIQEIVNVLVERQVPAVFMETTVADRNIKALIEGARARGHSVVIGGALFSDAMGAPGTYEGTYVGMIDHNVTTIVRALGGEAPARGHLGQLSPPPNIAE